LITEYELCLLHIEPDFYSRFAGPLLTPLDFFTRNGILFQTQSAVGIIIRPAVQAAGNAIGRRCDRPSGQYAVGAAKPE
jgi:hypothetical protein